MFTSERFLSRVARLRKEHRDEPVDRQVELAREAFLGLLGRLPPAMAREAYEVFSERVLERAGAEGCFFDHAAYLSDLADLFNGQYDTDNDPLVAEDWPLVAEIVNDYALEMDMGTVNYVMCLVIDHHGRTH